MKHLSWKLLTVMLDADRAQVYNIFAESTTFMLQILMLNGNESFWQICADEMLETRTDGTFVWFGVASTASSLKNMDCTLILTCVSLRRVFLPHWLMVRFHISLYLGINNNLSSASWNIYESCLFCQPWVNRRSINVMRSFLAIDPLPGNILILRQNGNKKNSLCVSLLPSVCLCRSSPAGCFSSCLTECLFVFVLSGKLTRSQHEYETCAEVSPEGRALLLLLLLPLLPPLRLLAEFPRPENSFATQTMTIWMENGTWSYYALGSHSQGAADVPWWCWTRVANWGVHEQMICKINMNSCDVLLQ